MPAASIHIEGNVSQEPELTFTPAGKAKCRLSVACNERRKNPQGQWDDGNSSFFDVTVWEGLAEAVADQITKGAAVIIDGKMTSRTVEKDGQKRTYWDVTANTVAMKVKPGQGGGAKPAATDPWTSQAAPF